MTVKELVELVTDCGVLVVSNSKLANELTKKGFMVTEQDNNKGNIVLHKTECEPPESDLLRLQSLVVDAYAPYSPKAAMKSRHPFAQDLDRHGKLYLSSQTLCNIHSIFPVERLLCMLCVSCQDLEPGKGRYIVRFKCIFDLG